MISFFVFGIKKVSINLDSPIAVLLWDCYHEDSSAYVGNLKR